MFFHTAMMLPCWKSQGTYSERLIEENKCSQPLQVDPDNGVWMDLKKDMDELVSILFFSLFWSLQWDLLQVSIGIPENSYDHEQVISECNLSYIIISFSFRKNISLKNFFCPFRYQEPEESCNGEGFTTFKR